VPAEGRLTYLGFKVDRQGQITAGKSAHDIIREATHLLPSVSSTVTWACRFCNAVVGGQIHYYGPFARYEPSSLALLDTFCRATARRSGKLFSTFPNRELLAPRFPAGLIPANYNYNAGQNKPFSGGTTLANQLAGHKLWCPAREARRGKHNK
jgi:hypothetical protein